MAKLTLKKHQRALVANFKRYQLDDLGLADDGGTTASDQSGSQIDSGNSALLQPTTIQAEEEDTAINKILQDEHLTAEQLNLLMEIKNLFDLADSADCSILYECTGFKSDVCGDTFWEQFAEDF
mmetsp:Transcript_38633/g.50653  ORF Transcript_38633/g.50653 Transcript_38633/m.50653 type:complete len:124 (-) Transcript_38633:171-542(-)|eukprot:CAMPEP_0185589156 /NCGR_PEP_ID=MMETSP0434-20130131/55830_1 /TAXON_ID=626734 ORGANISM="Favella taraikaensis, Strain Fe Narragansett Bay" /NCGR_SAMPLE_ID=MMETSP0434 /ASSEMBLY_ACC=CAM_ASM_000379 /LENGTH=123 /DNA_ID=CAMNT_0028212315 /DNA_START=682 /DNA_END=1053 /DNA_ORIENTATION=+